MEPWHDRLREPTEEPWDSYRRLAPSQSWRDQLERGAGSPAERDFLKYLLALLVCVCGVAAAVPTSGEVVLGRILFVTIGVLSAVALAVLLLRRRGAGPPPTR